MEEKAFEKNKEDLIHDINSAVMAVTEALRMIKDQRISFSETTIKILPLLCEKMDEMNHSWRELKKNHL